MIPVLFDFFCLPILFSDSPVWQRRSQVTLGIMIYDNQYVVSIPLHLSVYLRSYVFFHPQYIESLPLHTDSKRVASSSPVDNITKLADYSCWDNFSKSNHNNQFSSWSNSLRCSALFCIPRWRLAVLRLVELLVPTQTTPPSQLKTFKAANRMSDMITIPVSGIWFGIISITELCALM